MGFGHAVYRYSDPRNAVIKECALQVPNLIHIRQIQLFGQIRGLAGQELCVGQAQNLFLARRSRSRVDAQLAVDSGQED